MLLENLKPIYYHGTSTALGIEGELLPPSRTERLSEVGRKKNLDKVFFTRDKGSAEIYAKKAVKQFGGEPVIYIIEPVGNITVLQDTPGTTVFMADSANVVGTLPVTTKLRLAA